MLDLSEERTIAVEFRIAGFAEKRNSVKETGEGGVTAVIFHNCSDTS